MCAFPSGSVAFDGYEPAPGDALRQRGAVGIGEKTGYLTGHQAKRSTNGYNKIKEIGTTCSS
jgi:hypothetical protein